MLDRIVLYKHILYFPINTHKKMVYKISTDYFPGYEDIVTSQNPNARKTPSTDVHQIVYSPRNLPILYMRMNRSLKWPSQEQPYSSLVIPTIPPHVLK